MKVFFDGLCEPVNPGGVACYGFVVYRSSPSNEVKVFEGFGLAAAPGPDSTHNVAEYTGIIKALEWVLANLEDREIEVLGDSQLVIRHLTGEYSVRSARIVPFYEKARSLLEKFSWTAKWIPRKENSVADELSMKAYRGYCMKAYGKVPLTMRQSGAIE